MKKEIYMVGGFVLVALILYGYSQILPTCDAGNITTNESVSDTTIATTTTTEETTTTTTPPAEDGKTYKSCQSFCKAIGYDDGGECRVSGMECRKHLEVKSLYGSHLCTSQRIHTCCCQTPNSE
jgi:hypothetical protein